MSKELSKRLASIAGKLRLILGLTMYNELLSQAEAVKTYDKLSNQYKFVIEYAESSI